MDERIALRLWPRLDAFDQAAADERVRIARTGRAAKPSVDTTEPPSR